MLTDQRPEISQDKTCIIKTQGFIFCIDCSPNGQSFVCEAGQSIKIYDLKSYQQIGGDLIGNNSYITSIKYSPDGYYLVSGGWDNSVRIWDVITQQQILIYYHENRVRCVAYSIDGQYIASGSKDKSIKLWNTQNQQQSGTLLGHEHSVMLVQYFPNGQHLLSGSLDKTIRIWKLSSQEQVKKIQTRSHSPVFSFDGKFIISAGDDINIKVWDSNTGKQIKQFHQGHAQRVAVSSDHRFIVSGSNQGTIQLWEIATGKQIGKYVLHGEYILAVEFSIDSQFILSNSGGQTLKIIPRYVFEDII